MWKAGDRFKVDGGGKEVFYLEGGRAHRLLDGHRGTVLHDYDGFMVENTRFIIAQMDGRPSEGAIGLSYLVPLHELEVLIEGLEEES